MGEAVGAFDVVERVAVECWKKPDSFGSDAELVEESTERVNGKQKGHREWTGTHNEEDEDAGVDEGMAVDLAVVKKPESSM